MKIGIDARFVGPGGTGLGKYTQKLILNLAKIDKENQYIIFLKENNWSFPNLTNHKNFTKVLADVPWYSLAEQYKMPAIYAFQNLDLLHVPHFNVPILYKGKFIVTIHDLIHHKFREYAATTRNPLIFKIKRFGYKKVIENAVYKSQKIITPSNYVKEDILKNFTVDPSKIVVTYEAAEEEYFAEINYQLPTTNYQLIYVGNAYPHKNLPRLLDALKILTTNYQQPTTRLIIVCPRDVFSDRLKEEVQKRGLEGLVDLKGYLEPQELAKLVRKASAYVVPSLSEGFGIPGLNAMVAGIPVVASNIPVLKEVYSTAALYFNPQDSKDIAAKINKILIDQKTKSDLVKKGRSLVGKYSWLKMAQETLSVYNSIF
ncbi:glycosyltransferase family 4 protein [Candidatus Woesebacteria bacterium]|nr:glycosyltransferase family 4 protein [Candidatus Woesebacteria bacterium]